MSVKLGLLVGVFVPLSDKLSCAGLFVALSTNDDSSVVWLMSSSLIWLSTSDSSLGSRLVVSCS